MEGDPGLRRQHLNRLSEGQVVDLLHEGDDISAFTASEAVVGSHLRAHVEGGRAFVVEWAQPFVRADTCTFEGYVSLNDFADIGTGAYFINVFFAD